VVADLSAPGPHSWNTTLAAFLALMKSAETLHARAHQLQHRKDRCVEVLASLANIRGRAHRTQRSHETDANREAIAVEAMQLLQYELVPPPKERTAEEDAEAEKGMSEREVALRARLETACQELNEIVAAGSHGNDDLVPLGYGDAGNLQVLRQDHHGQLAALNAELANVNLLRELARQAKGAACAAPTGGGDTCRNQRKAQALKDAAAAKRREAEAEREAAQRMMALADDAVAQHTSLVSRVETLRAESAELEQQMQAHEELLARAAAEYDAAAGKCEAAGLSQDMFESESGLERSRLLEVKKELVTIIATKIDKDKELDAAAGAERQGQHRERAAHEERREGEHMIRVADRLEEQARALEDQSLALLSTKVAFEARAS